MKIRTFDQLDNRVLVNIRQYLKKIGITPRTREDTVKWAKRKFSGWTYGDTIYFKIVPSRREMVDTLIHEYIHWKRKSIGTYRYKTPRQQLLEETISTYLAEKLTGKRPKLISVVKRTLKKYTPFRECTTYSGCRKMHPRKTSKKPTASSR